MLDCVFERTGLFPLVIIFGVIVVKIWDMILNVHCSMVAASLVNECWGWKSSGLCSSQRQIISRSLSSLSITMAMFTFMPWCCSAPGILFAFPFLASCDSQENATHKLPQGQPQVWVSTQESQPATIVWQRESMRWCPCHSWWGAPSSCLGTEIPTAPEKIRSCHHQISQNLKNSQRFRVAKGTGS